MTTPNAESYSRTDLIIANSGGASSFADAHDKLQAVTWSIAGTDACAVSIAHQAALLTAVNAAARAVGTVIVDLPEQVMNADVLGGVFAGKAFRDVIGLYGGIPGKVQTPDLMIGSDPGAVNPPRLVSRWSSWTAIVDSNPVTSAAYTCPSDAVVAAIASAGLAINELFRELLHKSDATRRQVVLPLWDYTTAEAVGAGPGMKLPASWWLVGLGHLGQAYAWVLSWMYIDEPQPLVFLQDFDEVTEATLSTGLLTHTDDLGRMKIDVVKDALEGARFNVQTTSDRLSRNVQHPGADADVSLIGVDKPQPRQILSFTGSKLCVDAGVGGTHQNFTRISLHVFPGVQRSDEVAAWRTAGEVRTDTLLETPAYKDALKDGDPCGVVQIAGRATAATFVGAVTACTAVSEVMRRLNSGPRFDVVAMDISHPGGVRTIQAMG